MLFSCLILILASDLHVVIDVCNQCFLSNVFFSAYSQPRQWNQLASAWRLLKRYIYTRYNLRYKVKAILLCILFDINTECSESQLCSCQCFHCSCFKLLSHSKHVYLLTNQYRLRGSDIKFVLFSASMWKIACCHVVFYVLPNFTPVATTLPIMYGLLYSGCIGVMKVIDRILI